MTAQEVADLFRDLELQLIGSLKRNLGRHEAQEKREGGEKNGVPEHWEAWQSAKLRDMQRFRRENEKIVESVSPVIDQETKELIRGQYAEGGADEFFSMNDRRVNALLQEMEQAQANVEKAALRYMDDVYRRTVRGAALGMATGSMTMQKAVDLATKDFLAAGITCIRYRNGRRVNIASYAEMALRTAATRATLQGEAAQREQLGIDTVLVSQYGACSDTCLPWQGLVYIDDVFQAYSGPHTLGGTYGVSRNGQQYPLLSVAVRAGLFHPNCRHTLTTWIGGMSKRPRPMDKAKIEAVNQLEKKQRYLERREREAKRQAEGLLDSDAAKQAKRLVRRRQSELKEFVDAHGDVLRRDPWRERYDGTASVSELQELDFSDKPVTMQSISKIRPVESQLLSAADQRRLANIHKKLLMTVSRAPLGTEYGECYNLNMERLTPQPKAGEKLGRVRLPDFPEPYIAVHNHPNGLTFSVGDIQQVLERQNLKMLTAVGNNGRVYAMEKASSFSPEPLKALMDELKERYSEYVQDGNIHLQLVETFFERAEQYGLHLYTSSD